MSGVLLAFFASGCLGGSTDKAATGGKGCESNAGEQKVSNVVVVLFDHSQSTGNASVSATYTEGFNTILDFFKNGEGGLLAVAPIDADSLASFHPLECVYPKKGSNTNPLVYSSSVNVINNKARARADEVINGPRGPQGTSIFDALTSASHLLGKEEPLSDHRYLVIFSDMVESSDRLQMLRSPMSQSAVASFISRSKSSPYFPDLSGVDVYVAGAGVSSSRLPSAKRDSIGSFWVTYFKATGATLDRNNYNPSLTSFP